jgi:esterase/lipase superfamily enzyme
MISFTDIAIYGITTIVAVLIYALLWGLTRANSRLVKILVRGGLPVVLVGLTALFAMVSTENAEKSVRSSAAEEARREEALKEEARQAETRSPPPKLKERKPTKPGKITRRYRKRSVEKSAGGEDRAMPDGEEKKALPKLKYEYKKEAPSTLARDSDDAGKPDAEMAARGPASTMEAPGGAAMKPMNAPAGGQPPPFGGNMPPGSVTRAPAESPAPAPMTTAPPPGAGKSAPMMVPPPTPEPEPTPAPTSAPESAAAPPAEPSPAAPMAITEAEPSAGAPAPRPSAVDASPPAEAAPPPPPAPVADTDWDVVPVFFGTDRKQDTSKDRHSYGSGRGRRLELGHALVTVPKAHKVPEIERPWAISIPYINVTIYEEDEDPKKHFTMKEIKALSEPEFLSLIRERLGKSTTYKDQAFIFIHGYNTTFDYAIYRTAQIAYDLKFDGAPFAYSWPSGGGLASYTYDRESSGQAQPYLKKYMEMVIEKTGAKAVSVIAHSMGNQPVLQVLKDLRASKPDGAVISQIVLAAPDVDRDSFENIAREIQGLAKGVTLYAAGNDRALRVSRNFYGGIPRAGDVPPTGPLVIPGIDTIDVTAESMDGLGINHSGYAENSALLSDIGRLLQSGTRPPSTRTPSLEQIMTDKGPYWRYPDRR